MRKEFAPGSLFTLDRINPIETGLFMGIIDSSYSLHQQREFQYSFGFLKYPNLSLFYILTTHLSENEHCRNVDILYTCQTTRFSIMLFEE